MPLASLRRPLAIACLTVAPGLGGCFSTATYGTGQAPEMAIFHEMTGGLGQGKKESIEYQPRAPLVMPPSAQLPAPAQVASADNAQWPVDPDQTSAGPKVADETLAGGSQAEYRRLKPLAGINPGGSAKYPDDNHQPAYDIVNKKGEREAFKAALDERAGFNTTERRFLTEPPDTMRAPAPTAQTEFEDIKPKRDGNILTRWLVGGS